MRKNKSFYQYLMAKKGPSHTDNLQLFATEVSKDSQFPKHSKDYDEISSYLELNTDYLNNLSYFDDFWEAYLNDSNY
ncbi:MAG TPA: YozE family protein [Enterococcus columbae]|nr:YozE family protein [Enterococcus columbae]